MNESKKESVVLIFVFLSMLLYMINCLFPLMISFQIYLGEISKYPVYEM